MTQRIHLELDKEKSKRELHEIIFFAIDELKEREDMSIHQFCQIFYGQKYSRKSDALGYLRGKYAKFIEEGFVSAYGRLDMNNRHRVIEWITDMIYGYIGARKE